MAFTYDVNALDQAVNKVRFLVQDTVDAGHFFEDEEITFAVSESTNIYRVAADLCRAAAAKLSRTPTLDDATVKFDAGDRAKTYMQLAAKYDAKADEYAASLTTGTTGMSMPTLPTRDPSFTRDTHLG